MFVWLAISGLAASGTLGFPGIPEPAKTSPPSGVNASKTIDVSGLKAQIKSLLDDASGYDSAAVSNSTLLNDTLDKRQVTCGLSKSECNCSGSQCDCPQGQCDCSKVQCVCLSGCPQSTKVTASIAKDRPKREEDQEEDDDDEEPSKPKNRTENIFENTQEAGIVGNYEGIHGGIRKRMAKQDKSSENDEDDDDDDADEVKNATDSNNRPLPRAMLDSEKRLYVRSVDIVQEKRDHGADLRDAADLAWKLAFRKMPRSAELQPDYANWDDLYAKMNEFRLKRGAEKAESVKAINGDELKKLKDQQRPTQADKTVTNESVVAVDDLKRPSLEFVPSDKGSRWKHQVGGSTKKELEERNAPQDKATSEPAAAKQDVGTKIKAESNPEKSEPAGPKKDMKAEQGKVESAADKVAREVAAKKDVGAEIKGESTQAKSEPAIPKKGIGKDQTKDAVDVKDSLTGQLVGSGAEDTKSVGIPSSIKETKVETHVPETKQQSSSPEIHDPEGTGSARQAQVAGANTKKHSDLVSSWGNSYDSEKWQTQRRLGDGKPSDSDFSNLDIRYLGGNDLPIPPVDIHNFNPPEDISSHETDPPQAVPSAVPLGNMETLSGSTKHAATCATLVTSLILLIAPRP